MIVLKATQEQFNLLNGFKSGQNILQFVKDGADNWIVGIEVLTDDNFKEIRAELEALIKIEYKPKPSEIL